MEKKYKLMKRNYSDSPFSHLKNTNNQLNTYKINNYIQEASESDSSSNQEKSEYTSTFEEFKKTIRKKDNKIKKYTNKINELLLKSEENKYKCLKLEKLNKSLKIKIENLQQEIMKKDLILQKFGINEEETTSQNNSERINFGYLEKIYFYEKQLKILNQKNLKLASEVTKNRKIIINLNKENNNLRNTILENKFHFAFSPFQNHNNININNYKIKNNNKNNLNLNIEQKKFQTGNNFYHPKKTSIKNNITDNLSNEYDSMNMHKSISINRKSTNQNIGFNINIYKTLKENYIKKNQEFNILHNNYIKLKDKYNLDCSKFINNINKLNLKNQQLNKLNSDKEKEIQNLKSLISNIDKNFNCNINKKNNEIQLEEKIINDNDLKLKKEKINKERKKEDKFEKSNQQKIKNIKNISLISDEEEEDEQKNNEDKYLNIKLDNDLKIKTDLLKQKEEENTFLKEESKKLEDKINELNILIENKI